MQAILAEKTPVEDLYYDVNLLTRRPFNVAAPDPSVAVIVRDWDGVALSGITCTSPAIGGTGNGTLQFRLSGGTIDTAYYIRFIVTTIAVGAVAAQTGEIDFILSVKRPGRLA